LDLIPAILIVLGTVFFGVPLIYYLYLWRISSKPWKLMINEKSAPSVTIIIPARNEEKTIRLKLTNVSRVMYPKEKMQVIVVDDASTDATVQEASKFAKDHPDLYLEILSERARKGKSAALNFALKHAKHDINIVSDADTFWSSDILVQALPFLSDPSVGAVCGRQILLDSKKSLLTQTEKIYLDFMSEIVKLGESKIHSTILYNGLFGAYKRKFLDGFNTKTDDSGTALDVVQKGARTIYVPTARCYEAPPFTWKGKIRTKLRRANQQIGIYIRCFELLMKRRLSLPLRIAIPEIFIFLINPIIFPLLVAVTMLFLAFHLSYLLYVAFSLLLVLVISPKLRMFFIEALQDNFLLLVALSSYMLGRKFSFWETLDESRSMLGEDVLREKNLV